MRSPAANSASINPAASPQSSPLGVVPSPSCPSRAATPAGVCAAEPSPASLADPNAPSTTPCRSVVVRDEPSSSASVVSQTLLGFIRSLRHLERFTRAGMHHLAVVAVVPGSGAGRWSVGCGALAR
eukprot:scaffold46091_cov92-Phaeocystis_antarctica.AAC.6